MLELVVLLECSKTCLLSISPFALSLEPVPSHQWAHLQSPSYEGRLGCLGGEHSVFAFVVLVDFPFHILHNEFDEQLIDSMFSLDLDTHGNEE